MEQNNEKFKNKVMNTITRDVIEIPIKFPRTVYTEFRAYCTTNSNGCFWLGISNLLMEKKFVSLEEFEKLKELYENLLSVSYDLNERLSYIESLVSQHKTDAKRPDIKHFGKKEKKGE